MLSTIESGRTDASPIFPNEKACMIQPPDSTPSAARLVNPDIGDPIALPARETRSQVFALETRVYPIEPRGIDVFEGVHIDDGIQMVFDLAGDNRYGAAARADVKRCSAGTESIFGQ